MVDLVVNVAEVFGHHQATDDSEQAKSLIYGHSGVPTRHSARRTFGASSSGMTCE